MQDKRQIQATTLGDDFFPPNMFCYVLMHFLCVWQSQFYTKHRAGQRCCDRRNEAMRGGGLRGGLRAGARRVKKREYSGRKTGNVVVEKTGNVVVFRSGNVVIPGTGQT